MKKTTWLGIAFAVLVLAYLVISSFRPQGFRCRVCMSFKGRGDCRTASAATEQEALRTAITNACAQLSGGVIESNQCETTTPVSVDWQR